MREKSAFPGDDNMNQTTELELEHRKDGESETMVSPEGTTIEAPQTRPFEGFFFLRKEWIDQEDGIDRVTLNISLGQVNSPADWTQTETVVMMPEWGTSPLHRTWIVRLPTHFAGQERYLFHYFFQIFYRDGSDRMSSFFSQLIVPHSFECIDHSGEMLFVRLHWSIDGWSYPQDTELEIDGIDWGSEFSISNVPYRTNDRLFQRGRHLLLQRFPMPRRFRGIIWSPQGSEVSYCFQLIRYKPEGSEILWDNNFGKDYGLTI
jgi:hypothetical protein